MSSRSQTRRCSMLLFGVTVDGVMIPLRVTAEGYLVVALV